jgi:hypothetical protein
MSSPSSPRDSARRYLEEQKEAERFTEEVADQSVYVYLGSVMIAHLIPNTRWDMVEEPGGLRLRCWSWSPTQGRYAVVLEKPAGEWTYCGRGHPGQ